MRRFLRSSIFKLISFSLVLFCQFLFHVISNSVTWYINIYNCCDFLMNCYFSHYKMPIFISLVTFLVLKSILFDINVAILLLYAYYLHNVWYIFLFLYLEKEMAAHSSILAWRILWMEKPGELLSIGSQRVAHDWSDLICMQALEKEMAVHSSILAWRIPGMEEPGGLPSMGSRRVGHDWSDLVAAAAFLYFTNKCLYI